MKYEKAKAEVIVLDNSDIITGSNCPGNSDNKGQGQGGGNDCLNLDNNKQYCSHGVNSNTSGQSAFWDAEW